MKKIILAISTIIMIFMGTFSFATDILASGDNTVITETQENSVEEEMTPAAEKVLSNMSKKDRKIAEYTDKYNDKTNAIVAYYLDVIRLYSIPVWIICLVIGGFNFSIIGEKKLDKREQGFGFIVASLIGCAITQIVPFVFALLVAGK